MNPKHTVSLEIAKELDKAGWKKKTEFWWVNSSTNQGFEGEYTYWACDKQWNLLDFIPNPKFDETYYNDKDQGFTPDYVNDYLGGVDNYEVNIAKREAKIANIEYIPAPLATEILEELPPQNINDDYKITIHQGCFRDKVELISRKLGEKDKEVWSVVDTTLPNALAKMWLYLTHHNLIRKE